MFLVADEELSYEDLLIVMPVLRHLRVDTRTILEQQHLAWMKPTAPVLTQRVEKSENLDK